MSAAAQQEKDKFAGERLLVALSNLLRTVRIHDDANKQTLESVANFIQAVINACGEDEEQVTLHIFNGRFYFGSDKLLYSNNVVSLINALLAYFDKRELPGLSFHREVSEAPLKEILLFARLLNSADLPKEGRLSALKEKVENSGIIWAGIYEAEEGAESLPEMSSTANGEAEKEAARNLQARKSYSYALASLRNVAMKLAEGRRAGVSKSVRMVQNMVSLLDDDEPMLLGLSTLRIYDDYTYSHSVNVAMLSMCIGHRIGLSLRALERLGLSALFHDLGKMSIPYEIISKADKLTDSEFTLIKNHTLHSVRQIIMLRASQKRKAQILLPPFEHHMKFDLTGYPKPPHWNLSLFGRIISIADVFDAITSPRVYRQSTLSPDRAMAHMQKGAGTDFDPILLKVFINMLGLYPPGTLVELDTGEMAIVTSTPQDGSEDDRPTVVLVERKDGGGFTKAGRVNLADRDKQTGVYLRNVVNTYHPAAHNIQPAEFLF